MKVAYPTSEGCREASVPRTGLFAVVEFTNDGRILGVECRRIDAEPPAHRHHEFGEEEREGSEVSHARWHLAVLNALRDVDVVLAPHMGQTMVRGLKALGKKVLLGVYVSSPEEAVEVALSSLRGLMT